ncbi:hypothetical protein KVR01_004843 [Diaporthe batatas]|uniref:uncharacterized protein n=1 Tax=Diaporthe batatas TaxID=748121 RepID=UPI001D05095D|nr:uncharacterized protein KVR01_004843 [Diaporthe batatas]KAG8166291.1 hypothetical protein KVR01_004843 [Diaporthe batatas]
MPPAKKRKTAKAARGGKKGAVVTSTVEESSPPPADPQEPEPAPLSPKPQSPPAAATTTDKAQSPAPEETPAAEPSAPAQTEGDKADTQEAPEPPAAAPAASIQDRMARFRALQTRAKSSSASNLTAAQTEAHRLANDPAQLAAIQRKSAVASNKLLKADIEDAGGDFERKRAWDWTVDESEKWDSRVAKKERHRDDNAFSDYAREASKIYKRQLRNLGDPDLERYARERMRAIDEAAARGTLELVETEDGEMVAVDKDGTFYGGGGAGDAFAGFSDNKPDKKAVDRLVGELKKAEEVANKKRKERQARNGDDADVTYINDKNKQFNQKLARFYNKYTAEIRDSFERGTMI